MKSVPWWIYQLTFVFGGALILFSIIGISVKMRSGSPPGTPAPVTTNVSSNTGATVTNATSGGDTIAGAGPLSVDKSTQFHVENLFAGPTFNVNAYSGKVATDSGPLDLDIFVLWGSEVSWRFGAVSFNKSALHKFMSKSRYQSALQTADAIVCVGLASSWNKIDGSELVSTLSDSEQLDVEEKTDARAFALCKEISERTKGLQNKPTFYAVGLGYHSDIAKTKVEEEEQRSLVLLHVKTPNGRDLSYETLRKTLERALMSDAVNEVEGKRYSRMVNNQPICWAIVAHFSFDPSQLQCK